MKNLTSKRVMTNRGSVMNSSSEVDLALLDGQNGFRLPGISTLDLQGRSVSGAGDFNGDGYADLIIGAPFANPNGVGNAGESYLVFGTANITDPFEVSMLDGNNGIALQGVAVNENSGRSVSGAGDFNRDGFDDVVIGAPGRSYVVFGSAGPFNATLLFSELDGNNGFVIPSINPGDFSGYSVSEAGDVNGDGFADVIIGAYRASPGGRSYAGESYVVFGYSGPFPATFSLSTLDGNNGFVMRGVNSNDYAGIAVSGAGDINDDGFDDVLIGALGADPNGLVDAGECYVVFGNGTGFASALELSSLDGNNGFVVQGINAGDQLGRAVSGVGDVNGDGIADVIVGAPGAAFNGAQSGESYVIFGRNGNFNSIFHSFTVDGNNGFLLRGTAIDDSSGFSVSGAGDINGDGFDDVIVGALFADRPGAATIGKDVGVSYVVYGKVAPFIRELELSALDGKNGFAVLGEFTNDNAGRSVSSVGDFNNDNIDDILIGADDASFGGARTGVSYFLYGNNIAPILNNNSLTINEGNSTTLTTTNLYAFDPDTPDTLLTFIVSDIHNGQFEIRSNPGFGIKLFNQQDIVCSEIQFVHDGSEASPTYDVRVSDGFTITMPETATINFSSINDAPDIIRNSLPIQEGETVLLDNNMLLATDPDTDDTNISFIASNIQHGQFQLVGMPGVAITSFTQQQIIDSEIQFVHAGGGNSPSYDISASDGSLSSALSSARILYNSIRLVSLDGNNGFRINGIDAFDISGAGGSVGAGDLNQDGYGDVIIGARFADPNGLSRAGESYVVFGHADPFNPSLALADLDGNNGFVMNGVAAGDLSGFSVAPAGDINSDGIGDIIIGAYLANPDGMSPEAGEAYVVFGQAGNTTAILELSALDGNDGFTLTGINAYDGAGSRVSSTADINNDGFDDIVMDASFASPNGLLEAGEAYVVFGHSDPFNATLPLSSLDGNNGFSIAGLATQDRLSSVANAGDVNGDAIDDLIVCATRSDPNGLANAGSCYLIFGDMNGFAASFDLKSLNGNNGVVLNGVNSRDSAGRFVQGIGDVNGDTFDDILISAIMADPNGTIDAGEAYVVFGKVSFNSPFALSSLDGNNGFVLQGIAEFDQLGFTSPGFRGDFNGDGFDDILVGSLLADPLNVFNAGETYLIFGKPNGLSPILPLSTLDGHNGFVMFGTNVYDVASYAGGFSDINGDGFDDAIVSAPFPSPGGISYAGETYVIFGRQMMPRLTANLLMLIQGSTHVLTPTELGATDFDNPDNFLGFTVSDVQQGHFALTSAPTAPISSFTQQQIIDNEILFVHDGSGSRPSYRVSVTDDIDTTSPNMAAITFNARPILVNNQLTLNEGEMALITSNELSATDVDDVSNDEGLLTFTVSNVAQGQFESTSNPGVAITSFTQQAITDSTIQFVPDGSETAPSFSTSVSDGVLSSTPQTATISFTVLNSAPVTENTISNQLVNANDDFEFTFAEDVFSDPDNDPLTYSAERDDGSPLPNWLTLNSDSRTFSGTPRKRDAETFTVSLSASDPAGESAETTFNIGVIDRSEENTSFFGDTATTIGAAAAIGGGIGAAALVGLAGYGLFKYQKNRHAEKKRTDIELMHLVRQKHGDESPISVPETPQLALW